MHTFENSLKHIYHENLFRNKINKGWYDNFVIIVKNTDECLNQIILPLLLVDEF